MAQQGKQMRVGAREGFAYHSLELVLLANVNEYEVDSNAFFLGGKALYPFTVLPCHNIDLFFTHVCICCLWLSQDKRSPPSTIYHARNSETIRPHRPRK